MKNNKLKYPNLSNPTMYSLNKVDNTVKRLEKIAPDDGNDINNSNGEQNSVTTENSITEFSTPWSTTAALRTAIA